MVVRALSLNTIEANMKNLHELFTSGIAGIHFNRCKSFKLSAQMSTGCFPNSWGSCDEHRSIHVHPSFARFLETGLQARRPTKARLCDMFWSRTDARGTYQSCSHCCSFSTCPLFPQISFGFWGAYLTVHS